MQSPAPPPNAQTPPKTQSETAATTPTPIAVPQIAEEAQAASVRARRIQLEIDRTFRLEEMEKRLHVLAGSLQRFRPALESGDLLQLEELLNARQEVRRFSLQLRDLQDLVTPRSQALEARREELLKMDLLWETTLRSLARQDAPQTTKNLTLAVQHDIRAAAEEIRTSRQVLLTLQSRMSEQRIVSDTLLAQIDQAINETRSRLFTIDSEPLWRAFLSARLSASLAEMARGLYHRHALPILDYLRGEKARLLLHLLITGSLVLLLTAVRKKGRTWFEGRDGASEAGGILNHPSAAALVLSLLLSFTIYPNAPITLYRLSLLLVVIPLVRLLSGVLARDERRMFYFLMGLYLFRRLDVLAVADDLLHRIFLLLLDGAALLVVYWSVRADLRASAKGAGPWQRTRMYLVRLAGMLLLVSWIADVVGSVGLSTLLAEATISSAFIGAAFYGGVRTLESYLIPLLQSPLVRISPALQKHGGLVQRRVSFLVRLVALVIWAGVTVRLLGLSRAILDFVTPLLARQWPFGTITFSLGGILIFVVTIWLSALAARLLAFLFEEDILPRLRLPQGVPSTISMLVRYSVIVFGVVIAIAGAGVQWSQIALIAGAIGVGIGLGLQNLVSSFIAGLILIFERPIREGDAVEIGRIGGVVHRIGLRSSTIMTYDGSEVICPNSNLISQELVNWTLSNQIRRVEVSVGAAYGCDPAKVLAILTDVALKNPGVLRTPEPIALFKGFGASSLDFILRFFCPINQWPVVNSEVGIRIHQAFREAGIEIPFPKRDIRITSEPQKISRGETGPRKEVAGGP